MKTLYVLLVLLFCQKRLGALTRMLLPQNNGRGNVSKTLGRIFSCFQCRCILESTTNGASEDSNENHHQRNNRKRENTFVRWNPHWHDALLVSAITTLFSCLTDLKVRRLDAYIHLFPPDFILFFLEPVLHFPRCIRPHSL